MTTKYILLITATILLVLGCTSDPEVLEFDQNFNPTPPTKLSKKEKEKLTPPVDLLSVYAFFQNTEKTVTINRNPLGNGKLEITEKISPVDLDVKLTIPVEEATELEIVKMETTDEAYPKIIKGLTLVLPSEAATIANGKYTFEKGKKKAKEKETTLINFNKQELLKLNSKKQYALPIKIKVLKGKVTVVNYFVLNIKLLDIKPIVEENNIKEVSPVYSIPEDKRVSADKISFESNYIPDRVDRLKNGNVYSDNWWVSNDSKNYLNISIDKLSKIKSLAIYGPQYGSKNLKTVSIAVSQNNGEKYIKQGKLSFNDSRFIYIEFENAVEINAIRLSDFSGYSDNGTTNITEIQLFKE